MLIVPCKCVPRTRGPGLLHGAAKAAGLCALASWVLVSSPVSAEAAAATGPSASGAPRDTIRRSTPVTHDASALPDARLYLTWHAPYGQPGASDRLTAACGDTTTKDTLYMCFDLGRDAPAFQSFTATLYFWVAGGDTLDPSWKFGEGQKFKRLEVQYAPDSVQGADPAWPAQTFAGAGYSNTRASGKLRMMAAGPDGHGWPLPGGRQYVAARLLVPRPPVDSRGCDRPVCIEWALALFGLGGGVEPEINRGQRFVSWNSPGGKVCAPMREFAAPPPWQPRPGRGPASSKEH